MATDIFKSVREPIKKQIEKRQELMLQNSNYSQRTVYFNKRCDIRVTPLSYDITNPENYSNFVFNNDYMKGIIGNTYKNQKERPFIENFEIETKTGGDDKVGALRKGRMSIKVFMREQFNEIEKYFRIGSAVLIEWGWSKYVLSSGNFGQFSSHLYNDNSKKELEESDILTHIEKQTLESEGNYDAIIMFISNFSINFENSTNDYFYTLTVDFVGKELLLNEIVTTNQESDGEQEKKITNSQDQIFGSPLINYLRFLETIVNKDQIPSNDKRVTIIDEDEKEFISVVISDLFDKNNTKQEELRANIRTQKEIDPNTTPQISQVTRTEIAVRPGAAGGASTSTAILAASSIYSYNYISLKYFLKLLEPLFQNKYDSLDQIYNFPNFLSNGTLTKIIDPNIYFTLIGNEIPTPLYEKNKLFCSLDTRICILPHSKNEGQKIENIYLRVTYLKNLLLDFYRSNNSNFNNIITTILNDINRVTANELNLEYSSLPNGKYSIISNIFKPDISTDLKSGYLFLKAYNVGSIVEEVTIDTTVDSKIATTIAIATLGQKIPDAQVNSIGLLKFNKNIKSRLKTEFIENKNTDAQNKELAKEIFERDIRIINNLLKLKEFTHGDKPQLFNFTNGLITFSKDDIFTDLIYRFKKLKTDYIQSTLDNPNNDISSSQRNTPLIPVKYNFSIPGTSGLGITNVIKIDDERLPDIYRTDNSYFILTGIKHIINNRDWKTSINTNFQIS